MEHHPLSPGTLVVHHALPALQQALRRETAHGPVAALGYGHILFSELVELVLLYEKERPRTLARTGQYLLIKDILESDSPARWTALKPLIPFRGFLDIIVALIDELQQQSIEPEVLAGAAALSTEGKMKLEELQHLYRLYRERLATLAVWDGAMKKRRAREALSSGAPHPFLDGFDEIRFDNVYDISHLDFELIVALARRGYAQRPESPVTVTVTLPYNPLRQDAFRYLEHLVGKLEGLGEDAPANLSLEFTAQTGAEDDTARGYLLEHLFRKPEELKNLQPVRADGTVRAVRAMNPSEELVEICRECRELIARGVEPSQVAVVFRSLDGYREAAVEAARRFSLPFTFSGGGPLLSSHLARTLLTPFLILESSFSVDEVMKLLGSPYIAVTRLLESPGEEPLAPGELESLVVQAGVIDDETVPWDSALLRLIESLRRSTEGGEGQRAQEERALMGKAERLRRIVARLREALRVFPRSGAIEHYTGALRGFISEFAVRENIVAAPEPLERSTWALTVFQRDFSALEGFEGVLEDLERVSRALKLRAQVTRQEFFDLLVEGLKERNLAAPGAREGILVLDAQELVGIRVDYLFVGGLTEGQWPKRCFENVLLRDHEKDLISRVAGRKVFQSTAMRQWEENLLFTLAVSAARTVLTMTCCALDGEESPVLPSYFLESCLKLVEGDPHTPVLTDRCTDFSSLTPLSRVHLPSELHLSLVHSLFAHAPEPAARVALGLLAAYLARRPASGELLEEIFTRCAVERARQEILLQGAPGEGSPWFGAVGADDARALLLGRWGAGHRWTASQLESYGHCPFAFFVRHLLGLERMLLPDVEVDPTAEGLLAHDILEHYYRALLTRGLLPLKGDRAEGETLEEVARALFAKWEAEQVTGEPHFWELRRQGTMRVLRRWLAMEQQTPRYVPALFEAEFGTARPFTFSGSDGEPLHFRGRIDRVDVEPGGAAYRVLDYKNSRSAFYTQKLKRESLGTVNFQIPLYALAAEGLLREEGALATGSPGRASGYGLLKKPTIVVQEFGGDDLAAYFVTDLEARRRLAPEERSFASETSQVIDAIRAGRFAPRGVDCGYCDFDGVCRFRGQGGESE